MKELDGYSIPDLSLTVNGSCSASPVQAADAANRGWWTCGGYTRLTGMLSIIVCSVVAKGTQISSRAPLNTIGVSGSLLMPNFMTSH